VAVCWPSRVMDVSLRAPTGSHLPRFEFTSGPGGSRAGGAVLLPPTSNRNRSFSRSTSCSSPSERNRTAASSMASGMPSSRRTNSTTRAWLSSVSSKGATGLADTLEEQGDGLRLGAPFAHWRLVLTAGRPGRLSPR
jgi:hypothetical protein